MPAFKLVLEVHALDDISLLAYARNCIDIGLDHGAIQGPIRIKHSKHLGPRGKNKKWDVLINGRTAAVGLSKAEAERRLKVYGRCASIKGASIKEHL